MISVRGGAGLGDALYIRIVGAYLATQGHKVTVCSNYKDAFIGADVKVEPFRKLHVNVVAHYAGYRANKETTQWRDVCNSAQVPYLPMRFKWDVINHGLVNDLRRKAEGRPLIVVHGGRAPFGRLDGLGLKLVPERRGFDEVISELRDCFFVRVGNAENRYPLGVDIDLNGSTTVTDLFDIVASCDGVVSQVSFMCPMAEALDKPLLAVWSARGLESTTDFVRQITPRKILENETSRHVIDDWTAEQIREGAREFRVF